MSNNTSAKRWLMHRVEKRTSRGWKEGVSIVSVHCCSTERVDEFRSKMLLVIVGSSHLRARNGPGSIRLMLAIQRSRSPFRSEPLLDRYDRKTASRWSRLNEWTRKWWRDDRFSEVGSVQLKNGEVKERVQLPSRRNSLHEWRISEEKETRIII